MTKRGHQPQDDGIPMGTPPSGGSSIQSSELDNLRAKNRIFVDCLRRAEKLYMARHPHAHIFPDGADALAEAMDELDDLRRRVQEAEHERNLLMVTLDEAHEDLAKAGLGPSLLNDRIRTLIAERDAARQRAGAAEAQVRELRKALHRVVAAYPDAVDSANASHDIARAALARLSAPPQEPCVWTHDEAHDKWDTGCGEAFMFIDGGPVYNRLRHCPYCGRVLKENAPPQEPQAGGPCSVHQLHGIGAVFAATPWVVRMGQRDVAFCVEQADAHTIATLLNKGGQP